MSYDAHLEIDTGGAEPVYIEEIGNYTWNVSPMFSHALALDSLYDLDGKSAAQAVAALSVGIRQMETNPIFYSDMNPENGWGDSEGALDYLRRIEAACRRHPKATLRIM